MAGTTRFLLSNRLLAATLLNGTGAPAPALDEVSPFTMAKLMNADRLNFYKSSLTPTYPFSIDFDLGANRSFEAAAAHAYSPMSGTLLTGLVVYGSTAANGYPPVSGNPWTALGTITLTSSPRDGGIVFAGGAVSMRYVRFEPNGVSGQFALGRLALGALVDLGIVSMSGYRPRVYGNRLETRMENGDPNFQLLNSGLATDFVLPFQNIDSTLAGKLVQLTLQSGSFTMFDYNDTAREVWLADMELEGALNWYAGSSASELWDHDLKLRGYA